MKAEAGADDEQRHEAEPDDFESEKDSSREERCDQQAPSGEGERRRRLGKRGFERGDAFFFTFAREKQYRNSRGEIERAGGKRRAFDTYVRDEDDLARHRARDSAQRVPSVYPAKDATEPWVPRA